MAVAVLFTASCAKEDISTSIAGGEANVTFTVDLPELGTRAYGDGSQVNILHYNVYEYGTENRLELLSGSKEAQAPGQSLYTITIPMLKGMKYDIVFWAENKECDYYDLDGKVITVNYVGAKANDETRDAFFGSVTEFDPTNPGNKTSVELRRPFAQLNAITTDCQLIKKSGITEMYQSSLKVTKLHNKFNIFSGEATGEATNVVFAIENIPAETKTIDNTNTDMHLAMNYLLVNGEKELVDVEFSFVGKRGQADFGFPVAQYSSIPVKRNYRTNIIGKLLTASTEFNVEIKADFGKSDQVVATDATAAQQALDNADKGTTIQLQPGVNYGTLLIRPVAGAANTITDCDYLVYRKEMLRKVEDLTIIGAPGAKVDGIKVVSGYIEGSTGYVVDIKNLVIDGIEFADDYVMSANHKYSSPVFVDLSYINVDGLTVKNCKLVGDNDKMNLVYLYGSGNPSNSTFNTAAKNITISNNVVDGIARLCELRQTENVTITGNTINNTYLHGMLLPVDNGKYSGNVTITDNIADGIKERFVRMAGAGNAVVVIKDNTIINYKGADADYIKVTDVTDDTNVTIENNIYSKDPINNYDDFLKIISDDTWYDDTKTELAIEDVADFAAFVETANSGNNFEGKTLKLTGDIDLYFKDITNLADGDPITFRPIGDTQYNGVEPFKGTFDGQGYTIKNLYQNGWDLGYNWDVYGSYGLFGKLEGATVKNIVIEGSESYIEGGDVSFIAGTATGNCVFENITINSGVAATYNAGCGSIIGWSLAGTYTFKNITIGEDVVLGGLWGSFDSSIGGIVGQAEPGATYNFENVTINCRIDAYNDCTASNDFYNYRMCGMIIGRCAETTTIDGKNYPDLSKYNLSFNNVTVNYGKWMYYHYCEPTPGHNGGRGMRIEPGYSYGGLPADYDHSQCVDNHLNCIPFDQLIGGDQYGVKGLPAVDGVTVNYPAEYTCPTCRQQHGVQ